MDSLPDALEQSITNLICQFFMLTLHKKFEPLIIWNQDLLNGFRLFFGKDKNKKKLM